MKKKPGKARKAGNSRKRIKRIKKIVAFGHKKRTGKDTAANELILELKRTLGVSRVKKIAFADPLYEVCYKLYGWAGFKPKTDYDMELADKAEILPEIGKTPRELLIDMGMAVRSVYAPTWVQYALNQEDTDVIIVSDMRFPNEFQAVKDAGGLCVKINRPSVTPTDDTADCALDDEIRWDADIVNDGSINRLCYKVYKEVRNYLNLPDSYSI